MSDFKQAYAKMKKAEYNKKENLFLHKHEDEKGLTVGGIYQSANPNALDYDFINKIIEITGDIKRASVMIFNDRQIQIQVFDYFKKNYWDKSRLSELHSQKMAEEIFMASVLYSPKRAVKMAQQLAKTLQDGIIGDFTLKALNNLNAEQFDTDYDVLEVKLAISIAHNNNKEHYLEGWKNRANDSWDITV